MRKVNFTHDYFPYYTKKCSSDISESPAYGVFVSQLFRYAQVCSKYEDFLFKESILVSKLLRTGIFFTETSGDGNSMVVIQTLFTNLTLRYHISWRVCSPTVTHDWLPVSMGKSWWVPHVGQEICTLSETLYSTPFGEFMISSIQYYIHYWICQFKDYVLFAWIGLTALSRTYFIGQKMLTSDLYHGPNMWHGKLTYFPDAFSKHTGFGFRTSIRITTWHRICVKPDHLYNTQSIDHFNLLPMFPNKQ